MGQQCDGEGLRTRGLRTRRVMVCGETARDGGERERSRHRQTATYATDRLRYTPPTDCDLRQQQRHTRTDADRRQRQPHRQTQRQMDRIRAKQERHENGEKRTNKGFERLTEKRIAFRWMIRRMGESERRERYAQAATREERCTDKLRLDCFPLGCPPGSLNSGGEQ